VATQTAVTRILIATSNLSDASSRILEAICESLGWDMGALWIFDQYARRLRCARTWTSPSVKVTRFEAISRQRTFTPGEGFPGRIWSNGAAAWVADITKDANFRNTPIAAEDGLHGAFGFPILLGSETLGVIEIFSREVKQPEDEILDFVHSIGSQIGHFVERKRGEEILKESEEQFRAAFEKAPVGIAHLGADGRFQRINQKLCEILGYTRKELLDLSIKGVTHPEDLNNNLKNFQKVLTGEALEHTSEGRYTMKDGTVIWANSSLSLVRDQFGQVKYLIAVIEDINQRKLAEAGLLEWKRRFEAAHQALGLRR
jgi:PAS domain S-box-containing protein